MKHGTNLLRRSWSSKDDTFSSQSLGTMVKLLMAVVLNVLVDIVRGNQLFQGRW